MPRERFRVLAHELDQLHDPHLFAPIDSMKLLLLPASPRLIPDAVETLFINLMRDKTISPKAYRASGLMPVRAAIRIMNGMIC